MKKILLVAGLLFCSQTIFAQLEKGMIAVGLTSNISTSKNENEINSPSSIYNYSNNTRKRTDYNITPTVSYFFSNHFAIGLGLGYSGYSTVNENTNNNVSLNSVSFDYSKTTSQGIFISPYVKYYVPLCDQVYFLLKGSYNTTFSTGKTSGYQEETNYDTNGNIVSFTRSNEYGPNKTNTVDMTVGISPGILFMPGKKIGLEFSLGNVIAYNSRVAKTINNTGGGTSKATTSGLQLLNFNTITVGTGVYFFF